MSIRGVAATLGLVVFVGLRLGGQADAQQAAAPVAKSDAPSPNPSPEPKPPAVETPPAKAETPKVPRIEKATFGGGCFWCIEAVYDRIPGVKSAVSGYAGGTVVNPTYEMVSTGLTGHAEVVQIEFDPDKISYEKLLYLFFKSHDPTTPNAQGPDFGTQYRSIILYHNDAQKKDAQKVYHELLAKRAFRNPIVTELVPFTAFYPAELYHQDYYRDHRGTDYSRAYIAPKLKKLNIK